MILVSLTKLLCCLIFLYHLIGSAECNCITKSECYIVASTKLKDLKHDQLQFFNNITDNNFAISTTNNDVFLEIKKFLAQIQKLLENVHVDENTMKNLNMEVDDLEDIADDLQSVLTSLNSKINITEKKLAATKDDFDDLYEKFYEFRESLAILKSEEHNLKQGSIDGALNITRESMERIKEMQSTMSEIQEILKEIVHSCNSLTALQFRFENITTEATENDQINMSQNIILNELYINYTKFNVKMCQVVNVTCHLQNCSDIFCMSKVETDMKGKIELLHNGLKKIKNEEKELDDLLEILKNLLYEYRQAKIKNEDTLSEIKAKLTVFNNTQLDLNKTIDKLKAIENHSVITNEIKNVTSKVFEQNFSENDDFLKELVEKINNILQNTTEAKKIMENTETDKNKAEQLLLKAMNASEKANQIEEDVDEVKGSLDETKDLITDLSETKNHIELRLNDTETNIKKLNNIVPDIKNAFNTLNDTCNHFDARRIEAEKLIFAADMNALSLTRGANDSKIKQQSTKNRYEELQNVVLRTHMKIEERLAETSQERGKVEALNKRINSFKESIKTFEENVHNTVRNTERQISENSQTLKILNDRIQSFYGDIDEYYKIIESRTKYYKDCTSNSEAR